MADTGTSLVVVVAAGAESDLAALGDVTVLHAGDESVAAIANRAYEQGPCHLLIVGSPVFLPKDPIGPALAVAAGDRRVATVSFFADGAAFLSFPQPRDAASPPDARLDAGAATLTLRTTAPALAPPPIPFAVGPVALLPAPARSAIGPRAEGPVPEMLVEYSLRGRRRGLMSVLDPSTFCRRLPGGEVAAIPASEPQATLVAEYEAAGSPLAIVHGAARAKVSGLQILIDAARLSPQEMGTQVATVGLIRALAERDDVARVCVALAGELPSYARSLRSLPKVDARTVPGRDFGAFGRVDVAHRPFQPDSPRDMDACRAVADRTLITVLDLIAYHAVSYQLAPEHWRTYRDWLRQSVTQVDVVVAPTHDVRRQLLLERLPVDPERILVAELGTDHLTGHEPGSRPAGVDGDFAVVLGADYTHKNRDLAVRAHRMLVDQGFDLTLVLAGTPVHGSSRPLEDAARTGGQRVVVLGDVTSEERNWLLRHAAVVLYPTSGEGFGLVPFEAARMGTATAFVPFGPLAELAGTVPVTAADWSPASLAGAAARLVADPDAATAQVDAILAAGARLTWEAGAAALTAIYREVLARPGITPAAVGGGADAGAGAVEELRQAREAHAAVVSAHEAVLASPAYKAAVKAGALRDALRARLR